MGKKAENMFQFDHSDVRNMNILITGSTNGIGKEAALSLGRLGANLYIHGRDREKGEMLEDKIRKDIGTSAKFIRADFSNLNEVRGLIDEVENDADELDAIVNNAGGYFRGNKSAAGDYEYTFIVNHLAPLMVTLNLIDLLRESEREQKRIVFTASEAHRHTDNFNLGLAKNPKNNWNSYCNSKLYNIMTASKLAREIPDEDIVVNSIHPGAVLGSKFLRNLPGPIRKISSLFEIVPLPGVSKTDEGAGMILYGLFNEHSNEYNGMYYSDFGAKKPSDIAQDINSQDTLWVQSCKVANIEPDKYI